MPLPVEDEPHAAADEKQRIRVNLGFSPVEPEGVRRGQTEGGNRGAEGGRPVAGVTERAKGMPAHGAPGEGDDAAVGEPDSDGRCQDGHEYDPCRDLGDGDHAEDATEQDIEGGSRRMRYAEDMGRGDELAGIPERRGGRHRLYIEDEGNQEDHRSDHAVQI